MRYILVGTRRESPRWCYYVTRRGCLSTDASRAGTVPSIREAKAELDYWSSTYKNLAWTVEKLPPRVSVATGALRSDVVEL